MERSNLITRREVKQAMRKFTRSGGTIAKLPSERDHKRAPTAKTSASAETAAYLANHFGIYLTTFQGS